MVAFCENELLCLHFFQVLYEFNVNCQAILTGKNMGSYFKNSGLNLCYDNYRTLVYGVLQKVGLKWIFSHVTLKVS